jgi:hypothetical protein
MTHRRIAFASLVLLMVASSFAAEPATPPSTRPATVRVAAVQCSSDLGDVAGNTKKLSALVEEAAGHGAKFVVLPEASVTGYLSQDLKTNWQLPDRPIDAGFADIPTMRNDYNLDAFKVFTELAASAASTCR